MHPDIRTTQVRWPETDVREKAGLWRWGPWGVGFISTSRKGRRVRLAQS